MKQQLDGVMREMMGPQPGMGGGSPFGGMGGARGGMGGGGGGGLGDMFGPGAEAKLKANPRIAKYFEDP